MDCIVNTAILIQCNERPDPKPTTMTLFVRNYAYNYYCRGIETIVINSHSVLILLHSSCRCTFLAGGRIWQRQKLYSKHVKPQKEVIE